jgi:hypothetical protein
MKQRKEIIKAIAAEFNLKLIECDLVMIAEEQREEKREAARNDLMAALKLASSQAVKLKEMYHNPEKRSITPMDQIRESWLYLEQVCIKLHSANENL